jgi:hypothetical protein
MNLFSKGNPMTEPTRVTTAANYYPKLELNYDLVHKAPDFMNMESAPGAKNLGLTLIEPIADIHTANNGPVVQLAATASVSASGATRLVLFYR